MLKHLVLLRGCFRLLFLYDVAEAIDLRRLRELLGPRGGPVKGVFPRRTPEHVRFEEAPITEQGETLNLGGGQRVTCSLKYYAFAVVVVQFEIPFEGDWHSVLAQASRWMDAAEIDTHAREIGRRHVEHVASAVIRPTQDWVAESYFIVNLEQIIKPGGEPAKASELLAEHSSDIVQLVRGESAPLAAKASAERCDNGQGRPLPAFDRHEGTLPRLPLPGHAPSLPAASWRWRGTSSLTSRRLRHG